MKPGFPVQVLTLKANVLPRDLARLVGFSKGVAPDLVADVPDDFALLVGQLFGCAVYGEGRVRSCLLPSELRCPKPQPTATIPCAMFLIAACAVHISARA